MNYLAASRRGIGGSSKSVHSSEAPYSSFAEASSGFSLFLFLPTYKREGIDSGGEYGSPANIISGILTLNSSRRR